MKLEQSASSSYLRHAARNSPNWSIFDVMKSLPLFHFIMVVNFSLLSSFEAQNLTHFGVLKMHCWCNHFGSMAFSLFHIKATIYSHFKVLWNNNKALILQNCPGGEKKTTQKWLVSCPRKAVCKKSKTSWKTDCLKSATITNFLKRIPQKRGIWFSCNMIHITFFPEIQVLKSQPYIMLQKHSKCEVKAWFC